MPCSACGRVSHNKPCEVLDYIARTKPPQAVWVLKCPFCKATFHHVRTPNLWRQLRIRGIPREVVRDLQQNLIKDLARILPETQDEDDVQLAIRKVLDRVEMLGSDLTFVDDTLYLR